MKRPIFRCTVIFLLTLCLLASPLSVPAASGDGGLTDLTGLSGMPAAPSIDAPSAILIEAKTGAVLYAKNADQAHFPASITKVMTALLTIENCSLDETVTFSYRATHELEENSSGIARTEGEEMSVRDCLYGLLIASANEVAQALAEHVSGSLEAFAELMNQRAAELGCTNTHFANPSGLNNPEHYTTAHDMALIFQEAIKNQDFRKIIGTTSYTVEPTNMTAESRTLNTSHALLAPDAPEHYEGGFGGKTGTTQIAEHTLVTGVERNGMTLITVVMRAAAGEGCQDSIQLFDYGYNNFQKVEVPGGSVIIPNGTDTESLTTVETAADGETEQDYYYNEDYYVGSGIKAETTPQTLEITQDTEEDPKEQQENDGLDDGEAEGQEGQESAAGESLYRNAMVVLAVLIGAALLVTIISAVKKKGKKKKRK